MANQYHRFLKDNTKSTVATLVEFAGYTYHKKLILFGNIFLPHSEKQYVFSFFYFLF